MKKDRLLAIYRRNRNKSSPNILNAIVPGIDFWVVWGMVFVPLVEGVDVVVLCVFSYILMPAPGG